MKLIRPSFETLSTTGDIFKDIERVGRVCYKSEASIKEGTAQPFVEMLIKKGHTAMLEHGTVYLMMDYDIHNYKQLDFFKNNKYSTVVSKVLGVEEGFAFSVHYITTNYRVLVENFTPEEIKVMLKNLGSNCLDGHEKRITVKLICDRGVSHRLKFVA